MTMLPTWMRRALLTTAVMNVFGAALFLPGAGALRELAGVPPAEHAVYLLTIAMFVLLFGLGYLYAGLRGRADPLFIAISAAGKLSFVAILVLSYLSGAVSIRAPLAAGGDLVFGLLFLTWLLGDARRA
jgi:hypothetical protein